jgi:hypothetical protein
VVFISLLLVALWARGNLRINSVNENKNNANVAEWRQSSRPSTQPPVETTSLKSVSVT